MDFVANPASETHSSKILKANQVKREMFDPSNTQHLKSYQTFLNTGNWGETQFFTEFPFVTVPGTVGDKFAKYALTRILKSRSTT